MAVTIPEELQSFVSRSVASGRFRSEDEAVTEALSLLQYRETRLDALRADLQVGVNQLDGGRKKPLDIEAIKGRGQAALAAGIHPS